ncbi:polysaccharide biosynthesis tyrosine autokinase [Mycolicibacterium aubagnense]|uniref:Chromosome partitioning protein n=1 Tax=Mycolicibacterium aubagnense TaxID=319707 RepID=A0ABM7IB02_9MYCO|nr:polysaccharide biosynthesis tyrosine autokinase [Mycolicibacterium aubagnense]TLH58375.1 protein tyrosine kinase [Mycolicibacterium aubagnense]WGI34304.1 AAA family ATPase [Mycolicibacterium aubagnense]BBX83859.1 chromosome partitioning protein [Mycolicibacterium aubagnense]
MEIKEYLRIFGRYWWAIVILAVVGGVAGWSWWQFGDREYQSSATLFVATQNGTSVTEAYQNNLFSQDRVNSYATLAMSEQVAARAVDQLKANISASELRSKITAVPLPKTVLLQVSVTDKDPGQAQTYASAVADQLAGLVGELETSRRGGSPAAGAIVVDEAGYPTKPLGYSMITRIGMGIAGGTVLGLIVAIALGIIDRRIRGRERVADLSGSLLMGALPADPARSKAPVVDLAADGAYAEALRELRNNLRFTVPANRDEPARVIAVASPSPSDGRTTVAVDLAAVLAETGKRVVLVDGDLRNPAVAQRLDLTPAARQGAADRGLSTVLVGENTLAEGLISEVSVGQHRIAVLPAGPATTRPGELWAGDHTASLFAELSGQFDYVVVDTPPLGKYNDGAVAAALSDGALLVGRIRHTTGSALTRAVQTLKSANAVLIGSVATDEPGEFKIHLGGSDGPKSGGGKKSAAKAEPTAEPQAESPSEAKTAAHQKP